MPETTPTYAAGRVCVGFSKPYVALYGNTAGTTSFSSGRKLARGVSVRITPETSGDNEFFADNGLAESDNDVFTGGTLELTVDGLFEDVARMIYGQTAPGSDGWTKYSALAVAPYIAVAYIAKFKSAGNYIYVPTIIVKNKFNPRSSEHATSEKNGDNYQTETISAKIFRDDSANAVWKYVGADETSEADAEDEIKTLFGIS